MAEDSFARLCHELTAAGFRELELPALAPLAAHFDRLLLRTDGYGLEILCFKDRRDGGGPIDLTLGEVRRLGRAGHAFTGKLGFTRMPVVLRLVELVRGNLTHAGHLEALRSYPKRMKVAVSAWQLSLTTGEVWTNAPLKGRFAGRKLFDGALAALLGQAPRERPPVARELVERPQVGYLLLGFLAFLFVLEVRAGSWSGILAPSTATLLSFGALFSPFVLDSGEWYRLVSAVFLHANLLHVTLNGVVLLLAATTLERLAGHAWAFAVFLFGGLAGNLLGLSFNDPGSYSLGASGGIMALLVAGLVLSLRMAFGPERTATQIRLLVLLIPSLVPIGSRHSLGKVDLAAHIGGALLGLLAGLLLLRSLRSGTLPLLRLGRSLAALAMLVTVVALAQAFANREELARELERLAEQRRMPVISAIQPAAAPLPRDARPEAAKPPAAPA